MHACAGQDVAAEELVDKFVPRDSFVQEATDLLEGATGVQQEMEQSMRSGYRASAVSIAQLWVTVSMSMYAACWMDSCVCCGRDPMCCDCLPEHDRSVHTCMPLQIRSEAPLLSALIQ